MKKEEIVISNTKEATTLLLQKMVKDTSPLIDAIAKTYPDLFNSAESTDSALNPFEVIRLLVDEYEKRFNNFKASYTAGDNVYPLSKEKKNTTTH